jgi:hypothetical protein
MRTVLFVIGIFLVVTGLISIRSPGREKELARTLWALVITFGGILISAGISL